MKFNCFKMSDQEEVQIIPVEAPAVPAEEAEGVQGGGGAGAPEPPVIDLLSSSDENESDENDENDDPVMPAVQAALNRAAIPDLVPHPSVDLRVVDLWFAQRRRVLDLLHDGDLIMFRRIRHAVCDEEVLRNVRRNYEIVAALIRALPVITRSFQRNMDILARVNQQVIAQREIIDELQAREPIYGLLNTNICLRLN